ncbi:MAG: lysophospholipid acyltransferase family protein [Polyangiaceae bacterium]|nr:lysophospholipid acyltransferase family protein [Polyangiaceae bacterium]
MKNASSLLGKARAALPDLRHDSATLRRWARWGAVELPDWFVRSSPTVVGCAFALGLPAMRHRISDNLRWVGANGSMRQTLGVFSKYAHSLAESFAAGSGRNDRIVGRVVGDANFQKARALGRGVVIATAHTSGWYAAGPILGSVYTDEVLVVMENERDAAAQQLQDQAKENLGLKVVHVGSDPLAAMPLLSHLRKGGVVALQMDRVPKGQRGVEVSMCGRPFQVPEGPIALAALAGAPILAIFGRRLGYLEYELEVGEAIVLPRKPSRDELARAAQDFATQIERFVQRYPTDWFHFG